MKKGNFYLIIGVIIIVIVSTTIILLNVNNKEDIIINDTDIENSEFLNNNLNNNFEIIEDNNNNDISNNMSDDLNNFQGNIENILPTQNDVGASYNLYLDQEKTIDDFEDEEKEIAILRNFEKGHIRDFEGISPTDFLSFEVVIYSRDQVFDAIQQRKNNVEEGFRIVYDPFLNKDIYLILEKHEDPLIGESSILWSSYNQEIGLSSKIYSVSFILKNLFINVFCGGDNKQKAKNDCINWAKFIENKI